MEETIYCKKIDVLILRRERRKVGSKNLRRKNYLTAKKEKGVCTFFKGKCTLKSNAPLLCKLYPIFFKINKKDESIIWLKHKKVSLKKLNERKKIAFEFLKVASKKEIKNYFKLLESLKLKEVEEERIPKEIFSVVKKKL